MQRMWTKWLVVLAVVAFTLPAMAQEGDLALMKLEGCKKGISSLEDGAKKGCVYAKRSLATEKRLSGAKDRTQHFGGEFVLKGYVDFQTLVANPKKYEGKTLKVEAPIQSVCKKKGCWMVISDGNPEHNVRIRMKDYGFFVPKDCNGQTAVIEGVFAVKILSEGLAKHYAEDAGKDSSKVKGERLELGMTATAINIIK